MMKYIPIKDKMPKAIKKSEVAANQSQKNAADIDYIAMMTDVELESEANDDEAQ